MVARIINLKEVRISKTSNRRGVYSLQRMNFCCMMCNPKEVSLLIRILSWSWKRSAVASVQMIKIRKVLEATIKELEQINILIPQLSQSARSLNLEDLECILSSSSSHLYFAEDDQTLLGMLTLVILPIPTGMRAWVEDVVVHADARGKGIGKLLTLHALAEAKQFGALTVDLTSRPNRIVANQLYQKVGFQLRQTNVYRFKHEL